MVSQEFLGWPVCHQTMCRTILMKVQLSFLWTACCCTCEKICCLEVYFLAPFCYSPQEMEEELFYQMIWYVRGVFPGLSVVKNPPINRGYAEDSGSIPGSGRYPEGGNGNPLQYSCLRNPMDRGAWQATSVELLRVGHNWTYVHAHVRWRFFQ